MKPEDIIVRGNIHVDDAGNSYLVQDNKITGVNPSYPLEEVIVDRFTPVTIQKLQVLGYYGEDYASSPKLDMKKIRKAMKYVPVLVLGTNEIGRD